MNSLFVRRQRTLRRQEHRKRRNNWPPSAVSLTFLDPDRRYRTRNRLGDCQVPWGRRGRGFGTAAGRQRTCFATRRAHGAGYMLPEIIVTADLEAGRLVRLLPDYISPCGR